MRAPYYFVASNRDRKIEYFNLEKKKKKKVYINIRHLQQVEDDFAFSATIYALASHFSSGIWAEARLLNNQLSICFSLHIDIPRGGMLSNEQQSYVYIRHRIFILFPSPLSPGGSLKGEREISQSRHPLFFLIYPSIKHISIKEL